MNTYFNETLQELSLRVLKKEYLKEPDEKQKKLKELIVESQ